MANLNPNRKCTHVVIDNFDIVGREGVYSGSYEDCIEFIQEQGDADIIGMYDIVPNWR
jgi:hypothetical protein